MKRFNESRIKAIDGVCPERPQVIAYPANIPQFSDTWTISNSRLNGIQGRRKMKKEVFNPTKYGMIICEYCGSDGYIHYPNRQTCPKCGGFGLLKEGDKAPAKTEGGTEQPVYMKNKGT